MLRNEVGWFDEEDNSADTLSMRLANDATFVRAAFSNRLSIFIQDSAAVAVAVVIGMFLHWRLALVALATLPILTVSAIAQVCMTFSMKIPMYMPIPKLLLNHSPSFCLSLSVISQGLKGCSHSHQI